MTNNILVVKLGGGAGLDLMGACADLAIIARQRPVVIVHGVSGRMAELSAERNIPVEMITSPTGHASRYTPPAIRDLFVEAAGQINREICELLWSHNIDAFSAMTQVPIQGERKDAIRAVTNGRIRIIRDDHSGSITGVDTASILAALNAGQVPVVPPLALSVDGLLNIDGDRASAALAGALHAEELIILSNVRGLFRNFGDESSFIPNVNPQQIDQAMNWAQGRMKRKVLGVQEAMAQGVQRVIIGDGRSDQPVTQALQGAGTVFSA